MWYVPASSVGSQNEPIGPSTSSTCTGPSTEYVKRTFVSTTLPATRCSTSSDCGLCHVSPVPAE